MEEEIDANKEDSDQLLKDGDIALEAALENTRVSQDLFNPFYTNIYTRPKKKSRKFILKILRIK